MSRTPKKLIKIGHVSSAKGLKGELRVRLGAPEADWLPNLDTVFLRDRLSSLTEEFETTAKQRIGRDLVLGLKAINTRNDAENLKGKDVLISEELFKTDKGDRVYLRELMDFLVYDGEKEIGRVSGFDSNGAQDILVVSQADDSSALIPLVKDFIVRIDYETKKIHMTLPEGLTEANHAL